MSCNICPRACPDRASGFCASPMAASVRRAALHFWEEPPISGTRGSGTVFFSGCSLRCVFCQNFEISRSGGKELSPEELRRVFFRLIDQGAHNINLVTPTHLVPWLLPALKPKLPVPVVYNCGGYENISTLRSLEGSADIYLPDLKYMLKAPAGRYSFAPDYPSAATDALREMYRQVGNYELDDDGIMQRGLIVRHLVLPGNIENTKAVIRWFSRFARGKRIMFSLMSQYVPMGNAGKYPEINRKLTLEEYDEAVDCLYDCGIEDGFVQEPDSATADYTPSFNYEGL